MPAFVFACEYGYVTGKGEHALAYNCYIRNVLNWIVIGIGDITIRRVIPAIQSEPRSCLYGLVTSDPTKAEPYRTRVWKSLDEALSDPEVHAVYVGTPVFLHAPQTIQALRAGKHVICEKPMAMNEAEARSMVEAAEQSGKIFGVAYYRRCYPKIQRAKGVDRDRSDRTAFVRRTHESHVVRWDRRPRLVI